MHWKQVGRRQNYTAVQRDGSRYTIDRLASTWMISYLPTGNAQGGRQPVPWLPGKQSLTNAKASCQAHADTPA